MFSRSTPGSSLKQTGVDEFRFTLKYKEFQEMFPFMKDAASKNGITIIYFMTKDTSMSFEPETTTAFGVTLDPRSVAHDISHIIDDYKEHEAYRKFKDDSEGKIRIGNKERRSTGTTGLIKDSDREMLASLANEYIKLTKICSSLPNVNVNIPDNDEIITDFWISSGIFGSLRSVRRRMFSRQDSLHEFFGGYIERLSKNEDGIPKYYPPVLPVTDPRRGGGVGHDPFLQSIFGNDFISLKNINTTRGQLMVSDDTFDIEDEEYEDSDSIVSIFENEGKKMGGFTPQYKIDLTARSGRLFNLEEDSDSVNTLLVKDGREFLINISQKNEDTSGGNTDWWDESDSCFALERSEIDATSFFRQNTPDERDTEDILEYIRENPDEFPDINPDDAHFNINDYDLSGLGIDGIEFSEVVKVTEIGVCRAYQFYKVCEAYGQYSDYFAIEDPENKLDNSKMREELLVILEKWERMDGMPIGYIEWDGSEWGDDTSWNNPAIIDFVLNEAGSDQKFRRGLISNMCGKVNININEIDRANIINDEQEKSSEEDFIKILSSIEEPFITQQGIDEVKNFLENSLANSEEDRNVFYADANKKIGKSNLETFGELSLETATRHIESRSRYKSYAGEVEKIVRQNFNPNVLNEINKINKMIATRGDLVDNKTYLIYISLGLTGKEILEAIDKKKLKFYKRKYTWLEGKGYSLKYEEADEDSRTYGENYEIAPFEFSEYKRQILASIGEDDLDVSTVKLFGKEKIISKKLNIEFSFNDLQVPINHGDTGSRSAYYTKSFDPSEYFLRNYGIKGPAVIRYISADQKTAYNKFDFSTQRLFWNKESETPGMDVKYYPAKSIIETSKPLLKYFMTIGFDLVGGPDYHDAMFGGDKSTILQALMTKFKQKRKVRPSVQAKFEGESDYAASSSTESGYREFVDGSFERRKEIIDKVHDIYSDIFKGIMKPEVVFDDNEGLVSLQILAGN